MNTGSCWWDVIDNILSEKIVSVLLWVIEDNRQGNWQSAKVNMDLNNDLVTAEWNFFKLQLRSTPRIYEQEAVLQSDLGPSKVSLSYSFVAESHFQPPSEDLSSIWNELTCLLANTNTTLTTSGNSYIRKLALNLTAYFSSPEIFFFCFSV